MKKTNLKKKGEKKGKKKIEKKVEKKVEKVEKVEKKVEKVEEKSIKIEKHWGSSVWEVFHLLTLTFDENKRDKYIEFFAAVSYILPCQICVDHYKKMLIDTNYLMERDKEEMINWMVNLHNNVNKRIGKREYTIMEVKGIYIDDMNNVKVNHEKILEFFKIVENYVDDGMSLVMFARVVNVVDNLIEIMPCDRCKEKLCGYERLEFDNHKEWFSNVNQLLR
jgi:hypothetical protein